MRHGKTSVIKIQFVEPMYALNARMLPEGSDWLYEIKLEGTVWLGPS